MFATVIQPQKYFELFSLLWLGQVWKKSLLVSRCCEGNRTLFFVILPVAYHRICNELLAFRLAVLFMAWDKFWYTNVLPFLSSCVSIMQWHLYSGDTLGTKASVPWMVGLGFVNKKPKNKMFIFYSASESTADIISSREIHVMDKKITINLPLWCCVLNLSSAVVHQFWVTLFMC